MQASDRQPAGRGTLRGVFRAYLALYALFAAIAAGIGLLA